MNKIIKNMTAILFAFIFIISCSYIFTTDVDEVVASESSTSEISKDVLSVKCQISENTTTNPETSKLRIVSTIDSLNYQSAGFDITYKGKEIPYKTTKVYESIEAVSDGVEYNYSPNVFDIDSKYFITITLINLHKEDYDEGILIKPYVVTKSGEKVYGTHRYVSVADALDNTVLNIPVEMATSEDSTFTVSDGSVSYNLEAETETKKSYYYDGTYTHFRVDTDRTALKSVTSFTFSDGTNTGNATYRNLNNSYDGTADTADETWYDENSDYNVIATSADLYGFVALSVSKNFNLETIYLGADIVINEGTSAEWLSNAADEDNTNDAYAWLPIATSTAFSGTFDGQGHTISGLYVNTDSNSQALFAQTTDDSTIQKLRMENSYFHVQLAKANNTACVAAIIAKGCGRFDTIYVGEDVVITTNGTHAGGIIGRVNNDGATISNCWFAGSLQTTSTRAGGIVGGVGADANNTTTTTISHCFNSGSVTTSYSTDGKVYIGGICGVLSGKAGAELKLADCLNVGAITSSSYTASDVKLGAMLGGKSTNPTYSPSATYSTSDSCSPTDNEGTASGTATYAKSEIKGFSGYNLNKLTFEPTDDSTAYWVVRANDTPALASLVDSAIRTIPSTAWHDEPESIETDGTKVYTISTLKDLYGFSKLSAEGESFAGEKIQLGADIKVNKGLASSWAKYAPDNEWLPIGKVTAFAGTFDGQGHTISGIYVKGTNYVGLFAKTADDSLICDVRLKNSYICDTDAEDQVSYIGSIVGHGLGDLNTVYSDAIIHGKRHGTGGLVGVIDGTGTSEIMNCQFDGSIEVLSTTQETRTGGIVGSLQANSANVIISHCLNTGVIHSVANTAATRMGGICGTVGGSCNLNVNDCLVVGLLTADGTGTKTIGALTGQKGSNGTIHIVISYASKDSYSTLAPSTTSVDNYSTLKEASNLVGELAYTNTYLEFDSPENSALFDGYWTLVEDGNYPQLRSFATGESAVPTTIKSNTRWYDTAAEGTSEYTIYTAEELYGLANLVNNSNRFEGKTICLGANIIINSGKSSEWNDGTVTPTYSWTRIGNGAGKPFAGTFDGKNHTISGVYLSESGNSANNIALFGVTSVNATIKNITLKNSCFKGNKAVGAIAGQGGGTFDTIYVKEDVYLTSADRWCGGIIAVLCPIVSGESASATAPNRISNCWFAGTLRAGRYGGGMTGSIGKHGSDEESVLAEQGRVTTVAVIEHCLNTGDVTHMGNTAFAKNTVARTGGICGAVVTLSSSDYSIATISDSLNIGTVTSEVSGAGNYGDVVGHVYGSTHITYSNVYATDESCSSNGSNSGTTTTGTITRGFAVSDIKGYDAYSLSLDYTNYWVARNGATPVLGDFADTNVLVSGDTAWYDEHTGTEDDKYIIDSVEELYGFAKLSYNENTFENEIIYLGANITVNSGNSSDWATVSPVNEWVPIGNGTSKAFAGTFDGQGHTISGLYADGTSSNIGLFGCTTADANIMNLTIENTYFRGKKAIGAVVGQGGGTFDTIYVGSDVYLESIGNWCGGIIALIKTDSITEGSSTDTHTINNCWFEGSIRTAQYGGGMTGSVGKYEDDTTEMTRYAGNLNITNCLSTGTITHISETITTPRVGGFVGAVVSNYDTSANAASLVSKLYIEDSISAGVVCSEVEGITKNIAAVAGHVFNGSEYTCVDVYATRECCEDANNVVKDLVTGEGHDVIRYYAATMQGFSGYVNMPGLVYDNVYLATAGNGTWVAVQGMYPVLKSFSAKYTAVDFAPFVLEGTTIANMVDEGEGNAVITVVDTDETPYYQTYIKKISGENGLGFVECYNNGETGLDNGAVYTSSYRKDDLVITVTYVTNTKTTYISAGADVEFSPYLDENTVTAAGGDDTFGETSLGMLQLESDSGSTYIIQLENGHFIVHDGGQTETDYANFVSYLRKLAGDTTPIIDAWFISHGHADHYGILDYVDTDKNGICDDFYVEGVYFTEPSLATREAAGVSSTFVTAIRKNASLLRTTTKSVTKVYRMYTGQKYFFDGATMEVLLTHEQLTGYTDFNETSVWCKYTIGSDDVAKTFLNGADSSTMGMDFMMDVYSANYLYSDIFAALHHGINTSNDFTAYLKSNTIQNGYAADGAILYSRKSDPEDYTGYLTSGSSESENWLESLITDAAKREIKSKNDTMNAAVHAGVGENKFFYYGAGTVKLNFTSDGITGGYIQLAE